MSAQVMSGDASIMSLANRWINDAEGNLDASPKPNVKAAVKCYTRALETLDDIVAVTQEVNKLRCSILTCRAECYIKQQKFRDAVKDAGDASNLDPTNVHAFYKRAAALSLNDECAAAYQVCEKGLAIDPKHSQLIELKHKCKDAWKKFRRTHKETILPPEQRNIVVMVPRLHCVLGWINDPNGAPQGGAVAGPQKELAEEAVACMALGAFTAHRGDPTEIKGRHRTWREALAANESALQLMREDALKGDRENENTRTRRSNVIELDLLGMLHHLDPTLFAQFLNKTLPCRRCAKPLMKGAAKTCDGPCKEVIFCSDACKSKAWWHLHGGRCE